MDDGVLWTLLWNRRNRKTLNHLSRPLRTLPASRHAPSQATTLPRPCNQWTHRAGHSDPPSLRLALSPAHRRRFSSRRISSRSLSSAPWHTELRPSHRPYLLL